MRWPVWIAVGLGAVLGAGWVGLQVQPASFPPYPAPSTRLQRVPLRADLPAPVARYYRTLFGGDSVPLVASAVLTGRGTLRFGPISLPARFRFTHEAGRGYRHYMEATWLGLPVLKVDEHYLDGRGRMELPFGIVEGPKTSSAANLGMWAEATSFPSIYVTDPRVRWEPIDDRSARLVVPSPEGEDGFTVDFDPTTGLIGRMRTLRYRDEGAGAVKLPWTVELLGDRRGAARWGDQSRPWLEITTEEVVLNPDVSRYVRGRGI
jgi:hypothetical protein